MVTGVVMPQMGLEVAEGTVAALHVEVGASVSEGDPLLEIETDKALTDVVAPRDGVVVAFAVEVGDTVPVGATLVELGDAGDEAAPERELVTAGAPAEEAAAAVDAGAVAPPANRNGARVVISEEDRRIRAAPVARRAAAHLGIPLGEITGTGPRGRVTLGDVERAAEEGREAGGGDVGRAAEGGRSAPNGDAASGGAPGRATAGTSPEGTASGGAAGGERFEPLSATRRAIARRMTASQLIPQFTLDREVDASWLLAEKARLSAEGPAKVGVNDLLMHALADVVVRHTDLAAAFVEGDPPRLRRRDGVDVGLAVATDRGLLVPVVRGVERRTLGELAVERARVVAAARSGRIDPAELSGATISLSSLAGFGVDRFDAMLNPGESAILAAGRTIDRVVPRDRGLAVVPTMTLTLTLDHRVVDGARGAAALRDLAELLEGGATWRT